MKTISKTPLLPTHNKVSRLILYTFRQALFKVQHKIWLFASIRVIPILFSGLVLLVAPMVAQGNAIDYKNKTITLALRQEPPQLDTTRATDQVSLKITGHIMEGLLRYDNRNRIIPAVAEKYHIDDKGALFYLRKNARWSDGKPVTAKDFVFAWRKTLEPSTASEYAFLLYPIKNAEAINAGKMPSSALGVRAVDDYTLEVELSAPIAYFDSLVAFGTYSPIREDFYNSRKGRYGANAEDLLYNGPFRIVKWVHGARLVVEKNEHYWDKDNIKLNRIDWAYISSDTATRLNLFKDNRIALVTNLDAETTQNALENRLRIRKFNDATIFFLEFNHRAGRPTSNKNLRRAIQLVFDPYEFAYQIIGVPGTLPGLSLFPVWLKGQHLRLRQEHPVPAVEIDYQKALQHLELAKKELGGEIPPLSLLVGDSPTSRKQAEYFQGLFKNRLGLTILIDIQIFKQRLAKMTSGSFDIVAAGWGPDVSDPITFGDLFSSWNLNNRGRYKNNQLDAWVRQAQQSVDPAERMPLFGLIQQHLHDNVVILPNYERTVIYVQNPALKGMVRRVVGPDPDFSRAWIDPQPSN